MTKKVLICGGRTFTDRIFFMNKLDEIAQKRFPRTISDKYGNFLFDVIIISGGASGADTLAIDWAVNNWCLFHEYKADWKKYGRAAGLIRNKEMLEKEKPDLVIAFPGGKGTKNMINLARKANVEVIICS